MSLTIASYAATQALMKIASTTARPSVSLGFR